MLSVPNNQIGGVVWFRPLSAGLAKSPVDQSSSLVRSAFFFLPSLER
jgi:hypothetical protein